jgi:hypothetical protein
MPAATPPSATILNRPMSPVRCTCVPPHSSRLLPMSSTRTSSPYFSPNSIIAPSFCASSMGSTRACAAALARISALTMRLDLRDLRVADRRVVGEVEARALGVHQRALLLHMAAQHLAQRLVHQVRGAVVAHGARAALGVDTGHEHVAHLHLALDDAALVAVHAACTLTVSSTSTRAVRIAQLAGVAGLAAAFGVEGRVVEHDHHVVAGLGASCTEVPST